jgi:hypothetical protein
MKHIDQVRGLVRDIFFESRNLYKTSGANPLTNCVVEIVERDLQGGCPVLSLRFYLTPSNLAYDDETTIGVEISLGGEMASSLVEQIQGKWPKFMEVLREQSED